ncbi:MAG: YdeI/OmpD-associated family protein [Cyclobacteriaceae bacterium]|nr:YdeI/OmpD-associated family protein [Cyclobacteriaceae bacterium]
MTKARLQKDFKVVEPKSRAGWRAWLQKNHTQQESIWLVLAKKDSGLPSLPAGDAVEEALCFGWIDSVPNKVDDKRYKILLSPRKPKSNWSSVNKKRVARLIKSGLMTEAGMKMVALAKKTGTWNALNDITKLTLPADLKSLFASNPKAASYFEAFPPSVKKGILEWIQNAKMETTRAKRINETVALAAKNIRANQYTKR